MNAAADPAGAEPGPESGTHADIGAETSAETQAAREPRSLGPLRMIWRAALAYPSRVALAATALVITALTMAAIPWGLRQVVDQGFARGADPAHIDHWFEVLLVLVLVLAGGTAVRFYNVSWLGERVVADIRLGVQANLLRMAPSFFEENSPKEISSRMTADTALIETVVGTTVSVALRNLITALAGLGALFWLAPRLTGVLAVAIPVVVLPIVWFGRRLRSASRTSQDRLADIGALVTEVLSAMRVVQAFNQESREAARFATSVERSFGVAKRRISIRAAMTSVVMLLVFGALTLLMWRGALGVASGEISGGVIAQFVLTGGVVAGAFGSLSEVYGDLVRGAGAASRLNELLTEPPTIAAPARPVALPAPPRGQIAFEGVTFRYPSRPELPALHDFTLTVEPGETVAIVGPSGAGKSTLFQLAERFHDPQVGTVKLDGVPLISADPAEVRRRIALVPQEGVLFAASARDNLRYGHWDAGDDAIWEAARAANAETFLRALPQGLDTFLGEDGARLSGGQRQRIAIARALLRDAPILLLDEATSALDAESEQLVQQALERLMASRTTLVIAHRLATVRQADRIIVMDDGRIVEQGTHDVLARAGGLYARLAALQFDESRFAKACVPPPPPIPPSQGSCPHDADHDCHPARYRRGADRIPAGFLHRAPDPRHQDPELRCRYLGDLQRRHPDRRDRGGGGPVLAHVLGGVPGAAAARTRGHPFRHQSAGRVPARGGDRPDVQEDDRAQSRQRADGGLGAAGWRGRDSGDRALGQTGRIQGDRPAAGAPGAGRRLHPVPCHDPRGQPLGRDDHGCAGHGHRASHRGRIQLLPRGADDARRNHARTRQPSP
jgi:ATP-binding cassette subfamily B protein